MHIFEGWSHGYLQMASLMNEARDAIDDIAGWVVDSFEQARTRALEREREEEAEMLTFTPRRRRSPPGSAAKETLGMNGESESAQPPGPAVESALTTSRRGRLSTSTPLTSLTEEELMRRRRVEAVEGISEPTPVIDGSALVEEEEGAAEEIAATTAGAEKDRGPSRLEAQSSQRPSTNFIRSKLAQPGPPAPPRVDRTLGARYPAAKATEI
ncbi:hypothetical protein AG1IA_03441 [Rhizoctonia solani AG-1 IA]|uniref:Uncharacterized protein n=1 Tax=Thanatephorus cucumeris (strain AG1-IA) TaxID=983506 RepID=L8X1N1_THACA|nr:hypothetical protein AG1IA_03441 [Rhizoctonia solani AG-1 IA]